MSKEHPQLPLFEEHARKDDPESSHERAGELTKTPRLTKMILLVLKYTALYPGETARNIGINMFRRTGVADHIEWPHKVMSRLVDAGWVEREMKEGGYRCWITDEGKKALESCGK